MWQKVVATEWSYISNNNNKTEILQGTINRKKNCHMDSDIRLALSEQKRFQRMPEVTEVGRCFS